MDETESCILEVVDWCRPFIEFFSYGTLPDDKQTVARIKRKSERFMLRKGDLFRRTLNGTYFRCLSHSDAMEALKKAHQLEHQGLRKSFVHLLKKGVYWPTMERNAKSHVRKCRPCQHHHHQIHTLATPLHPIEVPWPFHTWGLDLIGPIHPPVQGYMWILVVTEFFTK
ncbi:uncharacterized protein LOC132281211 [Cornus florida]|uniref:uncharacterized protein LOC132281211 n=1 Tax=Cornus florida TaxID=4283 RepID=UPI0028A2A776|nr:uncharacterized protein LOC132281211 [Cornus florida]